jgi:hypothetical protein
MGNCGKEPPFMLDCIAIIICIGSPPKGMLEKAAVADGPAGFGVLWSAPDWLVASGAPPSWASPLASPSG